MNAEITNAFAQAATPSNVNASLEITKAVLQAVGTIIAALIVGIFGSLVTRKYSREKDRQEKESQWREHAIELTKLDLQRKIESRKPDSDRQLRPSILDFLANYRDLTDLDHYSPKQLYERILQSRITQTTDNIPGDPKPPKEVSTTGAPE